MNVTIAIVDETFYEQLLAAHEARKDITFAQDSRSITKKLILESKDTRLVVVFSRKNKRAIAMFPERKKTYYSAWLWPRRESDLFAFKMYSTFMWGQPFTVFLPTGL